MDKQIVDVDKRFMKKWGEDFMDIDNFFSFAMLATKCKDRDMYYMHLNNAGKLANSCILMAEKANDIRASEIFTTCKIIILFYQGEFETANKFLELYMQSKFTFEHNALEDLYHVLPHWIMIKVLKEPLFDMFDYCQSDFPDFTKLN